jgi:hypothetical protein
MPPADVRILHRFQSIISLLLPASVLFVNATGQDTTARKLTLDGYVSFMESVMDPNLPNESLITESLLHNRLNLNYYPSDALSFSLQLRNRLIMGERIQMDETDTYKKALDHDPGVVDLSWNPLTGTSYVFNINIDRLWMKYARDKLEITAGRQRINWGQTFVWNTNDWFNNYSYFDVDYLERPGSDALRIQYYTSAVSGLEAVLKTDSTCKFTIAGLFKTNYRGYDMQFLAGDLAREDLALGFGWAGNIGPVGFRGEMSYLHPFHHMTDTTGKFLLSVAWDYTFSNSLMIQVEGFYNQLPPGGSGKRFAEFYARPLSVKDLSFAEYNLFAQASYPITPLFTGSLAVLYFPDAAGYYIGPAFTWSLLNNLDLSMFLQYFNGKINGDPGGDERQHVTLGFGRIRYSF